MRCTCSSSASSSLRNDPTCRALDAGPPWAGHRAARVSGHPDPERPWLRSHRTGLRQRQLGWAGAPAFTTVEETHWHRRASDTSRRSTSWGSGQRTVARTHPHRTGRARPASYPPRYARSVVAMSSWPVMRSGNWDGRWAGRRSRSASEAWCWRFARHATMHDGSCSLRRRTTRRSSRSSCYHFDRFFLGVAVILAVYGGGAIATFTASGRGVLWRRDDDAARVVGRHTGSATGHHRDERPVRLLGQARTGPRPLSSTHG